MTPKTCSTLEAMYDGVRLFQEKDQSKRGGGEVLLEANNGVIGSPLITFSALLDGVFLAHTDVVAPWQNVAKTRQKLFKF